MIGTLAIILGILLVLDLILVATRASISNSRLSKLMELREQHKYDVDRTLRFVDRFRGRVSLRLAYGLLRFLLAGISLLFIQRWLNYTEITWEFVGLLAAIMLIITTIEFILERVSIQHPEAWALSLTPFAIGFDLLLSPISALFIVLLPDSLKDEPNKEVTEDDLKNWVEDDQPDSGLQRDERRMIYSIFQFGETLAREIMVPRIDMLALDANTPLKEAVEALVKSGHSRIPVYENTIDNIIGILYAKDLLKIWQEDAPDPPIRKVLREPYFVPEAKKVDSLLAEMQEQRVHITIVVDEYGGVAGLVTLEDILEEIIGEVRDEYDQSEEMLYQQVGPNEYTFQGRIDLDDFNEIMGTTLAKDEADTLGGFLYHQFGKVPISGESIQRQDITLVVEQVSSRRIRKVRAYRTDSKPTDKEQNDATQ